MRILFTLNRKNPIDEAPVAYSRIRNPGVLSHARVSGEVRVSE